MSLMRLLTTGKSLVGMRSNESPYRLTNQRLLPQFGSTRNPFQSNRKSEPAQREAGIAGNESGSAASRQESGSVNACCAARAALPGGAQDRAASSNADGRGLTKALQQRAAALLGECKRKVAGIFGRRRVKAAKPAIPRFTKPAVQGELSLDKIKVVRNDLSDADLEVVPAKVASAPATAAPALRIEDKIGAKEARCRKATAELFGAGQT